MITLPFMTWLPRISGAAILVLIAIGISVWQKLDLEKDILIAVTRSFIQLIAIGYALNLIFNRQNPLWILPILVIMILVAGQTAGVRGKSVPHSRFIATIAIAISTIITLGTLILFKVFSLEARFIIPIAGMIIGNGMTATGLAMARLRDDIDGFEAYIETALALGATSQQAIHLHLRKALMTGMSPIIDQTKTVGLISLPGAMTGMILGGASPLEAVQLQIVVMYMLIGASSFGALTAVFLTYRQFFTPVHQLKQLR